MPRGCEWNHMPAFLKLHNRPGLIFSRLKNNPDKCNAGVTSPLQLPAGVDSMFRLSSIRNVSILPIFFGLTACGGGGGPAPGGDSGGDSGAVTGSGDPVSSTGVITGFGSVYLNGVKYEVEKDTRVAIEGEPEIVGDDSPLRLGMKVRVQGSEELDGRRVARRIEFDGDLKGPVRDVRGDAGRTGLGSFTVLGQKVTVDANTIIDNAVGDNNSDGCLDYRDLGGAGQEIVARVSGFPLDDGILATRVDRMDPGAGEVKVRGRVTGVAEIPVSVELNGNLIVNLGSALFGDGLSSAADLNVGSFIEVKGGRVSDSVVNARVVEPVGKLGDEDRRGDYEIAGVLQAVRTSASPHEAVINGISFRVSDATALSDKVGMRVEIKGRLDNNDVLVLASGGVRTELENSVHSVDLLASVDSGAGTLKTRLGLSITPGGSSRVSDATRQRINMHLDDFIKGLEGKGDSAGLPVVVDGRGYPGQGGVTWTRVDIGPAGSGEGVACMIRGPVESVDAAGGTFTIQGVTVNAGAGAPAYRDDRGGKKQQVSRAGFFSRLTQGLVVMAVGNTEKQASSPDCTNLYLQPDFLGLKDEDGVYGTVSGR